jgi:hypothetical protein
MRMNVTKGLATLGVLGCGLYLSGTASAEVIGTFGLNGGTVTVSPTNLTWIGPATVANGSNLGYGAGGATIVATGTDVTLGNLPGSLPTPIDPFMTFAGTPLDFVLDVAGPGSSNLDCSPTGLSTHGGQCSAFLGNPIVLSQAIGGGTLVALNVSGTVTDGSGVTSIWQGLFDETIVDLGNTFDPTPAQIQAYFSTPGAVITEPYSGTFVVTVIPAPEPSSLTMMLMGAGLLATAFGLRRKYSRAV